MSNTTLKTTSDLHLAAYLSVAGVPFEGAKAVEDERGRVLRVKFEFRDDLNSFDELKKSYFARQAVKIKVLSYADELRNLKNLTHEIMKRD